MNRLGTGRIIHEGPTRHVNTERRKSSQKEREETVSAKFSRKEPATDRDGHKFKNELYSKCTIQMAFYFFCTTKIHLSIVILCFVFKHVLRLISYNQTKRQFFVQLGCRIMCLNIFQQQTNAKKLAVINANTTDFFQTNMTNITFFPCFIFIIISLMFVQSDL